MQAVINFIFGYIIFAFFAKVWWVITIPGRLLIRGLGFGSSLAANFGIWLVVAAIYLISTGTLHLCRNAYLATFTDQTPVPMRLTPELGGLRFETTVSYVPYAYENGRLKVVLVNDTPYPLHKVWLACESYSKLYPDDVARFQTDYLFMGVMPPGQRRVAESKFQAPAGGAYMTKCRLGGAEIPYGWWEGIPADAMKRKIGEGPSPDQTQRKRLLLDDDLQPIVQKNDVSPAPEPIPIIAPALEIVEPSLISTLELLSEGVKVRVRLENREAYPVSSVALRCLIPTTDGVDVRTWTAFKDGVQAGARRSDSVTFDVINATGGVACSRR